MIKAALLASVCLLPWAAFFFARNRIKFAALCLLDFFVFILLLVLKIELLYCFFFLAAAMLMNAALFFVTQETSHKKPFNFLAFAAALIAAAGAGFLAYGAGMLKAPVVPAWEAGLALVCAGMIFLAGFRAAQKGEEE